MNILCIINKKTEIFLAEYLGFIGGCGDYLSYIPLDRRRRFMRVPDSPACLVLESYHQPFFPVKVFFDRRNPL